MWGQGEKRLPQLLLPLLPFGDVNDFEKAVAKWKTILRRMGGPRGAILSFWSPIASCKAHDMMWGNGEMSRPQRQLFMQCDLS